MSERKSFKLGSSKIRYSSGSPGHRDCPGANETMTRRETERRIEQIKTLKKEVKLMKEEIVRLKLELEEKSVPPPKRVNLSLEFPNYFIKVI